MPRRPRSERGGASPRPRTTRGRFEGHRRGDGWVIPDPPDASEDIHVTRARTGGALPGDRVEVEALFRSRRGRLEGDVVRVLSRSEKPLVGWVAHDGAAVNVLDREWTSEIRLPAGSGGARLPEVLPDHPPDSPPAPGDLVEVRISRHPAFPGDATLGEIVRVFGARDDPRAQLDAILAKHRIRDRFPEAVAAEAASAVPSRVLPEDLVGRDDFRNRLILTIDPESAGDHDDAIEAEALPDGGFAIGVHIADVSRYVEPGGAVDREAALRGTSTYFPERAVPMLPAPLSSGICSLVPDEDRLTLSVRLRIGPNGELLEATFSDAVIRSAARLTYEQAAGMLAGSEPGPLGGAVRRMGAAAAVLTSARERRGAVDLDLPEPVLDADPDGRVLDVRRSERSPAHRLVEEFMLLANQAAAERLRDRGARFLSRVHGPPAEDRCARFEELLGAFGERLRSPGEPIAPRQFARLLGRIEGRPEAPFLRIRMLRAMKKAEYAPGDEGHFALALPAYTHFTSPIRRYPDLLVHRALRALGPDGAPQAADAPGDLAALGRAASEAERRAESAERGLASLRIAAFLAGRLGDGFPARIAEVGRFGLLVELDEIPASGVVPMSALPDERLRFRKRALALVGDRTGRSYRIGDPLEVRLARVDRMSGELEFATVGLPAEDRRSRRTRTRRPSGRGRRG